MQQIDHKKIGEMLDDSSDLIQNSDFFNLLDKRFSQTKLNNAITNVLEIEKILSNPDLQQRGIEFSDLLKLSGYFGEINQICDLKIINDEPWMYQIKIISDEFDRFERTIDFNSKTIRLKKIIVNQFKVNQKISKNYLINLIYFAQAKGFDKITLMASKMIDLSKKHVIKGYFFYPKFWFIPREAWTRDERRKHIKLLKKFQKLPEFYDVETLHELFLLEDAEERKLFLEYWKKMGDSLEMEFDLSKNSSSWKIFEEYLETYLDND